jgi:hypothetical protein
MSTLNELRTMVRDITDLEDEVDIPTSLIDLYVRDGFERILNLERRWPFLEETATFNTVAAQREYPIANVGNGDFREITSIVDTSSAGNRFDLISHDEAERIWLGTLDTTSRPLYWSEWDDIIHMWPKPDAVYPIKVRGYRKPSFTWLANADQEIDCDDRLHIALAYYAISRAYQRQEDPELAAMYKQSFDEAVALARRELTRGPSYRNLIMSGGSPVMNERLWLQHLGRTLGQ